MKSLSDFYEENDQSLRKPKIVLRDNLGTLAVQILASRPNFSSMSQTDMLYELHDIICKLHKEYDLIQENLNI